ncbi:glycosyltransferase family 4 protein [Spiribacter sp. 1M153]|uniref:glycosyltransferase family 4 protein n=1 Tax=Spiribacter roseus TaxID=1855875 RepID=UPI00349F737C
MSYSSILHPLVAITNSTTEYVVRFRLPLLNALRDGGYDPVVVAPSDAYVGDLHSAGFSHYPFRLQGASTGLVTELTALRDLHHAYRQINPALALHFTPKVDIYGGLVARRLKIPFINNLSGMGTAITRGGWLGALVNGLLRSSQGRAAHVFVQNSDDRDHVRDRNIAQSHRLSVLPGSGIDLNAFPFTPLASTDPPARPVHFVMIARLVAEKGVNEFMEAAQAAHAQSSGIGFSIAGDMPSGHSGAVSESALQAWSESPGMSWLGKIDDVRPLISDADCVVLPSYREGTPRVLLEAAAMGRPVIAADSIGTREPLIDGQTGLLCAPRDSGDLADKMLEMLHLGPARRAEMGQAGRRLMEQYYDVRFVVDAYMDKIRRVLR